jgi:hypothetical protein
VGGCPYTSTHLQGWPEPYIYGAYVVPSDIRSCTACIYGAGQPYAFVLIAAILHQVDVQTHFSTDKQYTYVHARAHTRTHMHTHVHTSPHTNTHAHTHVHTSTHTCTHAHTCTHTHTCTHAHTHTWHVGRCQVQSLAVQSCHLTRIWQPLRAKCARVCGAG